MVEKEEKGKREVEEKEKGKREVEEKEREGEGQEKDGEGELLTAAEPEQASERENRDMENEECVSSSSPGEKVC